MRAVVRAGLLCAVRRSGRRAAILVVALPALALLAGERAGPALQQAVASSLPAALSTGLGFGATAAVAGVVVALAVPRRRFLGAQLAAAPLSPAALFAAVTLVPLLLAGLAASAVEAAFLVPALGAAAPTALAAGWAGFALGAATAEGGAALRGSPAGAVALAGVAGLWALGAVGAGTDALFGPFGYLGLALRGEELGTGPAALAGIAVAAFALWGLAAAFRPDDRPARGEVRAILPTGGGPLTAAFLASLKRLGRRGELRRTAWTATAAAAAAGLVLAVLVGAEGMLLGASLAVLGAALVPLAAAGIDGEAEWLWRASPAPRWATGAAAAVAGLVVALLLVTAAVAPAAGWAGASAGALLQVLALAVFTLGAAAIAGALLPWRSDRPADELASFGALVAVATGLWFVLGRAAESLGGGTAASVAVLTAELVAAMALAGLTAARGPRC
ncbi:MAG: hypothetical protein WD689_07275 [Gaiellaceae bacterium]